MGIWEESLALRVSFKRMLFSLKECGLSLASRSLCILLAYASFTLFPLRTIIPLHTRNDSESG